MIKPLHHWSSTWRRLYQTFGHSADQPYRHQTPGSLFSTTATANTDVFFGRSLTERWFWLYFGWLGWCQWLAEGRLGLRNNDDDVYDCNDDDADDAVDDDDDKICRLTDDGWAERPWPATRSLRSYRSQATTTYYCSVLNEHCTFSWLQHYTCTNKSKNLHHHYCSSDFLSKKWVFALSESPDLQHTPHTPLTQGCNRQYLIFTLFNQYIHFCRRCIGFESDTNASLRLTIFGWWEEARGEKVLQPWVWASVVSSYSVACSSNHANWLLIPNFCSVHQMVNVPLSLLFNLIGSMYFWSWLNSIEQGSFKVH